MTPQARRYWTTDNICRVPALGSRAIVWEQEAGLATFSLDPLLLMDTAHATHLGATGELVWVPWQEQPALSLPSVSPALLVHTPYESRLAARVTIVPSLPVRDPLLQHIALVLQAQIEGKDATSQLYTESLANALVVHFLKRYEASRRSREEVIGGLSPYKLRRTTTYIKEHLEQELSLATLAAVSETSPAHFARLFKHATGRPPHQYVILCRIEHAKQLLAETDVSLGEVGLQVGCADQSHFTALFHRHVAVTPKAYRDTIKNQ
jgi:AraC family transcriptional regulator